MNPLIARYLEATSADAAVAPLMADHQHKMPLPGEACPSCGAVLERGDDGTCNRCGADCGEADWPLLEAVQGNPYETTTEQDWGGTRGQGRRSGGMIMGAMSDMRGKKTYVNPVGKLPREEQQEAHHLLDTYGEAELDLYIRDRMVGRSHDEAMLASHHRHPSSTATNPSAAKPSKARFELRNLKGTKWRQPEGYTLGSGWGCFDTQVGKWVKMGTRTAGAYSLDSKATMQSVVDAFNQKGPAGSLQYADNLMA